MNDEWENKFNEASQRVCEYTIAAIKHESPLSKYCEYRAFEAALDMATAYNHMKENNETDGATYAIEKAS